MDLSFAVMLVANRFQYRKDSNLLFDSWSVMRDKNGVFYGDCEDFTLTVFWYMANRNILVFLFNLFFFRYKLIWSITNKGEFHIYGKYGDLCFDNWTKRTLPEDVFLRETGHRRIMVFPMIFGIIQLILGLFKR